MPSAGTRLCARGPCSEEGGQSRPQLSSNQQDSMFGSSSVDTGSYTGEVGDMAKNSPEVSLPLFPRTEIAAGKTESGEEVALTRLLKGLPVEIVNKINKTKQTRGAQPKERVVYQNRVNRDGIAVVPYRFRHKLPADGFENGHVFMVRPDEYFASAGAVKSDFDAAVEIGKNAFVLYDSRKAYRTYPPLKAWKARLRGGPGEIVCRMPATTSNDADQATGKVEGEAQGIRFFEYAGEKELYKCCIQLALLAWHTKGINDVRTDKDGKGVPAVLLKAARSLDLWDESRMTQLGVYEAGATICPLCRKELNAKELMSAVEQVEGREVVDLTVTEANLFHMLDLRPGEYNHRHYSLGWGHFHCNAVARDHGIEKTLDWMGAVLKRNGYHVEKTPQAQSSVIATKVAAEAD